MAGFAGVMIGVVRQFDRVCVIEPTRLFLSGSVAVLALMAVAMPLPSLAQAPEAPPAKTVVKKAKAAALPDGEQSSPRSPAAAQANVETAQKLLDAGKADQAVNLLSSTISIGNLPSATMAKALYLRGVAYRKQQKPAQAISDLTGALWLKGGLSDADRVEATQQRSAAYTDAGLSDGGAAVPRKQSTTAEASSPKLSSGLAPAAANTTSDAPSAWRAKSQAAAPTDATAPSAQAGGAPQPPRVTVAKAVPSPAPNPAAAVTPGGGQFLSRIALVKSQPEAEAVIAKLKSGYAEALAGKVPTVGEVAFGNMGKFYQVQVGSYSNAADAAALCGRLKGSGLDCVAISR